METIHKWKVLKLRADSRADVDDIVADERRLRISINGKEALSLYCSPVMIRELVVGLLMTEGIAEGICTERMTILHGDEITVDVPAEGEARTEGASITSGCVGGVTFRKELSGKALRDRTSVRAGDIREVFREFHRRSELYESTGCIHSAALSDGKNILCFAEDIGRHNAVDKTIGCAILEAVDLGGKMMLASGRLSSEIVSKCARWGIPLVVSRTAPTYLSLRIARDAGVTVVGFVRGERMNVYTHTERVL